MLFRVGGPANQLILPMLRELVVECESLYPGIEAWFDKKIVPGISDGSRVAFVSIEDGKLEGGVIVHLRNGKVCNLCVREKFRGKGLGTRLFHKAANSVLPFSPSLHFTSPEELAVTERDYFKDIGFEMVGTVPLNYRSGQGEVLFSGKTEDVIAKTMVKMRRDASPEASSDPYLDVFAQAVSDIYSGKFEEKMKRGGRWRSVQDIWLEMERNGVKHD